MSTGLLPCELLTASAPLEVVYQRVGLTAPTSLFPLSPERLLQLQTLANDVNAHGGWKEVTRQNGWPRFYKSAKEDYERVWLPVLAALEAQYRPQAVSVCKGSLVKVVGPPEGARLSPEFWRSVLDEEAVVLRGFLEDIWGLNRAAFALETLLKEQGDQMLSVLVQEKSPCIGPLQLRTAAIQSLSLSDYLPFLTQTSPSSPTVLYASNIDISTWTPQLQELQRCLPASLCFQTCKDALRLTRVHISGMTLPQLYLPPTYSWIGVHCEQMNLSAVYVNYGPGQCQWSVVSAQHADLLRETVQKAIGVDYMRGDGLLFLPESVLNQANIPYQQITLIPGDVLYLGPGTVHWNSCQTSTVFSAWNLCPYTLPQFQACFRRDDVNRAIGAEGLMQIYTLAMDLLNVDLEKLQLDLCKFLLSRLETRFEAEIRLLSHSKLPNLGVFPGHQVRRCEQCRQELFHAYSSCNTCASAICVPCSSSHPHPLAANCVQFSADSLRKLLKRVRNWTVGAGESLFDPSLNQHFTRVEREREGQGGFSPYSGARDCIWYSCRGAVSYQSEDNGQKREDVREEYVIPKRLKGAL